MTEPRTRLLAAAATAVGVIATGFDAHLAPQAGGWWHGLTGSPSLLRLTTALVAAFLVWALGRDVNVRPFLWMSAGLLPFVPAITGFGAPLLFFSGYTLGLLFAILLGGTARDLVPKLPALDPRSVVMISFAFFVLVGRVLSNCSSRIRPCLRFAAFHVRWSHEPRCATDNYKIESSNQ